MYSPWSKSWSSKRILWTLKCRMISEFIFKQYNSFLMTFLGAVVIASIWTVKPIQYWIHKSPFFFSNNPRWRCIKVVLYVVHVFNGVFWGPRGCYIFLNNIFNYLKGNCVLRTLARSPLQKIASLFFDIHTHIHTRLGPLIPKRFTLGPF